VEEEQDTVQNENLKSFWHKQVKHIIPLLIPGTTQHITTTGNGEETLLIEGGLYTGIKQLAADLNLSVFTIITAITQLLLYSHTGATDLVTGTPVTGRSKARWNKLIGHFLNILVLRVHINREETFSQFLVRLKSQLMEMFEKQDYSFEVLKNECWDRKQEYPFFEIEISLQNFRLKRYHNSRKFNDLSVRSFGSLSIDPRKYPMEFRFDEGHEDIILKVHYDVSRYPETLVKQMLHDWQLLLELALAGRDETLVAMSGKLKETRQQKSKQLLHAHRSENFIKLTHPNT
jgi:non-ribosomal peptide synthetase component F